MVDGVPFERDGNISRRSGVEAWDNPHSPEAMYASIWKFEGDPDRLAAAYEAFSAELPPPQLRLALRAPDGLVVVDTCPTRDDFVAFTSDPSVHAGLERHGLGLPTELDGYPVLPGGETRQVRAQFGAR